MRTVLADLSDFACAHFVRFLRAGFWQICRKSFPGRKIFSAECWPENFPITKIFFLCAGKKFVQEFMSTMIFSSTRHKFSGEFPEKWENPEKGPFLGDPPLDPPKTPQNPPKPPPGGASLGEWYTTLHLATASHSTGWQKLPEYALIRIPAGGGWQKSPILDPPPGAQNHRFSTFFPLRRPGQWISFHAPQKFWSCTPPENSWTIISWLWGVGRNRVTEQMWESWMCSHSWHPLSALHADPKNTRQGQRRNCTNFCVHEFSRTRNSAQSRNTRWHKSVTQLSELCAPRICVSDSHPRVAPAQVRTQDDLFNLLLFY